MRIRVKTWTRVGLVLLSVAAVPWISSRAQNVQAPWVNLATGGLSPLPPPPPRGAWGEVIFANEKWIVVQNHEGQQFPIAADAINQFLVRWPLALADLTPQSWVEVIGTDIGSLTVQTDHVDVYEGADRTLVQQTFRTILPTNLPATTIDPTFQRVMNGFDVASQRMLFGWASPLYLGGGGLATQMYVVGSAINQDPLRLGILGNNIVTVAPAPGDNLTISQVTRGTPSMARKGDYVFLTPVDLTQKTVALSQLVLYKKIPLRQFAP
jgi:hypothetical protein